jgi:selenide,water dikinase
VEDGCIPGAAFRNLEFVEDDTVIGDNLDYNLKMIAMDAQTSGGLLMSVREDIAEEVVSDLHLSGLTQSAIVGYVTEKCEKYLYLES